MRFSIQTDDGDSAEVSQSLHEIWLEVWDEKRQNLAIIKLQPTEAKQLGKALKVYGEVLSLD